MRTLLSLVLATLATTLLAACSTAQTADMAAVQETDAAGPRVAVVTDSRGFVHGVVKPVDGDSVVVTTLRKVVGDLGGALEHVPDASDLDVADVDVVIFYTTGDIPLDVEALEQFVRDGGGVLGIHCATDTLHGNDAWISLIGGEFASHPWNAGDEVVLRGLAPEHPVAEPVGEERTLREEIYTFRNFDAEAVTTLVELDAEATQKKANGTTPIVWVKQVDDGRVAYTSLGHNEHVWNSDWYQQHLRQAILWSAGQIEADNEARMSNRPHDPWVFRCVLDKRPRVVVAALSDDLWAAWDATTCGLYKVFPGEAQGGGMTFTGSVYDTRHGPQPQTRGETLNTFGGDDVLQLWHDGAAVEVTPIWGGYELDGEQSVTLHSRFTLPGDEVVRITETPEAVGPRSLGRKVSVSGLPEGYSVRLALANGEGVDIEIEGGNEDAAVVVEQRGQPVAFLQLARDTTAAVTTTWPATPPAATLSDVEASSD